MLEIRNLSKNQGKFSLKDINLKIVDGTIQAIIGPTGCGKTTLLEVILGLRPADRGQIILNGKDITRRPPYERGFAYVPQDLALFPHLTAEENILFGVKYGSYRENHLSKELLYEIIRFFGIEKILPKKINLLSGGEKQRVALARALAPGSKYLLLDEPFGALHPGIRREIWNLVRDIQRRFNLTIILVSHDIEETLFLADFINIMIDGKIVQSDRKEIVYQNPLTKEVASYFGIKNIFTGEVLSKENGSCRVYCKELKRELILPSSSIGESQGREINFGIRAQNVIIDHTEQSSSKENILEGVVRDFYFLGGQYLLKVEPKTNVISIDVAVSEELFNKLSLSIGSEVKLSFQKEKFFMLN